MYNISTSNFLARTGDSYERKTMAATGKVKIKHILLSNSDVNKSKYALKGKIK